MGVLYLFYTRLKRVVQWSCFHVLWYKWVSNHWWKYIQYMKRQSLIRWTQVLVSRLRLFYNKENNNEGNLIICRQYMVSFVKRYKQYPKNQ